MKSHKIALLFILYFVKCIFLEVSLSRLRLPVFRGISWTILQNRERVMKIYPQGVWVYCGTRTVIPLKNNPCKLSAQQTEILWVSHLIHTCTWEDCHATQTDNQERSRGKYDRLFLNQNSPKSWWNCGWHNCSLRGFRVKLDCIWPSNVLLAKLYNHAKWCGNIGCMLTVGVLLKLTWAACPPPRGLRVVLH